MKIKLTESQLKLIEAYLTEREQPVPTNLSGFFNKHKNIEFFEIVKLTENGQESPYRFKYSNIVNGVGIIDMNQGTPTKGCTTQVNLDTILYDNEISIYFKPCNKELKLNKVIKIVLYNANNQKIDEMQLSNTSTQDIDTLVDTYNDLLHHSDNGSEVFFDSNKEYNGTVFNKSSQGFEIELSEQNTNKPSMILYIDFEDDEQPFYSENGKVKFKSKRRIIGKDSEDIFIMDIKRFTVKSNNDIDDKPDNKLDKQTNTNDDDEYLKIHGATEQEIMQMAKDAEKEILNDPDLKKAFYRKPGFWNLFISDLQKKNAKGSGILPTIQILNNYRLNKLSEKMGKPFLSEKPIYFSLVDKPVSINYKDSNDVSTSLTFNLGEVYEVRYYGVNDGGYNLKNKASDYIVKVIDNTEEVDVFVCQIIKFVTPKTGGIANYDSESNIKIKISRNSEGYKPDNNIN
jgi:hypothetical protein